MASEKKRKDNSRKHPRAYEEWQKHKRTGRPAQQFNVVTNSFSKIMEPRKVTE